MVVSSKTEYISPFTTDFPPGCESKYSREERKKGLMNKVLHYNSKQVENKICQVHFSMISFDVK